MDIITGVLKEAYLLFIRMAPYLFFGFFFAGVLHVFLKPETIGKHLGGSNLASVIKASLFGIPLPLCSCSVIPSAMSLRKEGASRGAVLSFLISTPTTGIDSIFATYSLLGGFFTVYRIIASFLTGVISGVTANFFIKDAKKTVPREKDTCKLCHSEEKHVHTVAHKIKGVFNYAFGDILKDSGLPLLAGVVIGGIITFFLPPGFIETYLGSGVKAMLVMLIIGIPMYVCATASIPIAAALMIKGINPGAAFVFLVAGPATNIVTLTVVAKNLGRGALIIYLGSIVVSSLILGIMLDNIYLHFFQIETFRDMLSHFQGELLFPGVVNRLSGIILFGLIVYNFFRRENDRCIAVSK
ncbi:MAG: SO_0444 family Cu/Zn efflux transporter [Candidatus Omnitrophota bacterium]